jgi:hypothetical protein
METNDNDIRSALNPFWPMSFLAAAVIIFLAWNIVVGARQYVGGLRISDQQAAASVQAAQAEEKLRTMLMDLVALSKTDADAQTIVSKYQINFSPPQQPAPEQKPPAPAPKPVKTPAPEGAKPSP